MGKVNVPRDNFFRKIFSVLLILISLIAVAFIVLLTVGLTREQSLAKAVEVVTRVQVSNELIGFKYFFVLLGIMGGVVQFYFIYVLLDYLLEGKFKDIFSGVRYMNKIKKMTGHFIIAGGGRVGSHAAKSIKKHQENIVIVDNDEDTVTKLRRQGFLVVNGDILDESFLSDINLDQAKHLVACLGKDSDNILLVLTVKEMNPSIKISARANSESVIPKLRRAGASFVVVPSSLGGDELAKTAIRS